MYGAWLVLWVAIDRPWPELLGAGIYSEKYPSCHLIVSARCRCAR
jgi:hypothetical protein